MADSGQMKRKDRGIRRRDPSARFPKGGWEVRWTDPEGFTKRKTFEKKADVTDFLDGIREDMKRSRYIDPKRAQATVRSVVEEWLGSLDVRPTTRAAYESMVKTYIIPGLGNVRLDRVSLSTLLSFKNRLDGIHAAAYERRAADHERRTGKQLGPMKPLSATRKHHVFQTLSTIFNYAVRSRRIDVNPMSQLSNTDRPKRKRRKFPFLDAGQVDALAQAVDPRYRTLVYFLGYSGLRAGEAVALRIEDIDWEEGSVRVDESISDVKGHFEYGSPKTDESERTVHLPSFLLDMLRAQVGDRALDLRAFVFPGRGDKPMRMSNFYNRHFKKAVVRTLPAKLHGLRLHDLRHTAASLRYVASGGDLKVVQEVLGHADLKTTSNIYLHAFNEVHRSAAERLDEMGRAAIGSPASPDASVTELPR